MSHRLQPLLDPRSIAVAGVSERPHSFGRRLAESVLSADFKGRVDFVTPRNDRILGRPCAARFADLDQAPDLAVIGVGAQNLETALLDAIRKGARAAVIFDSCHGETPSGAPLLGRLRDIAREAGIAVCGGAGMGVVNVATGAVASFYGAGHLKPGGITLIAHSGSAFTTLAMNDPRFRFDLLISPGQEIGADLGEYIAFAAERETTKAIAVFMETARNAQGFADSLRMARAAGKPVIICKVGRSAESARLARSHTGAVAGSRAAYEAVITDCGAISLDSVDQLMNTALLCSTGRFPGPGGLGLVTDSGGLRELAMDLAAETAAPLARLSQPTLAYLRAALPAKLEPSNPLDCAADLTADFCQPFADGLAILAEAPEVSMLGFEADLRDDFIYEPGLATLAKDLARRTAKPCFFYSSFARANNRKLGEALIEMGVPCINGLSEMLAATTRLQAWADWRVDTDQPGLAPEKSDFWRDRLKSAEGVDEHLALALLADLGVPTVGGEVHDTWPALQAAAERLGYPVVLKTAALGVDHKSDVGGVILDIRDPAALHGAWQHLTVILGARVLVQRMVRGGVELAFGCVRDPDFGPIVMVSAGGTLVEHFPARQFALAPISEARALRMIKALPVARLLNGLRGAPPCDQAAAARALATFSKICAALQETIAEVDINPFIVLPDGAMALDALIAR